jgi:hypothetical protein
VEREAVRAFCLLAVVVQEVEGGNVERLWLTGAPTLFKPGDNNGDWRGFTLSP